MENPDGGSHVLNFRLEDGYAIVGASSKDHHIVNIQLAGDITSAESPAGCCVVCSEPLKWVIVGQCSHRVVCSKCMIRIRHINGDKTCCICRAHCPTVMVTKAGGTGGAVVSAFREYWYHTKTGAYFDDLKQYQATREACKTELSPYYHPLVCYFPNTITVRFICMPFAVAKNY
jgi:hypothetical protein